jgi:uncharacterized membrane protein
MWYYTLNNQQVGPVEEEEIKKLVEAGTINASTLVWTAGMANWSPIIQTALAPLMGEAVQPVAAAVMPPPIVIVDPDVETINKLWMWFWISLIGTLLFGIGLIAVFVLFFIIFHKSWKLTEHKGSRANADTATAWCFIPGWGFYWVFPAFRGLAREFNRLFDEHNILMEKFDLRIPTWMLICLFGSAVTFGVSLIAFVVLWIIYTKKIKDAYIAVHLAKK